VRGPWWLLSLVALVVICAGLAQTSRGHALLSDAGLYKTPANYTELAFTSPEALPDTLTSAKGVEGQPKGQVPVSFIIHNVSGSSHAYQWSVAIAQGGKSQVKAAGTVGVPAQGKATVSKSVTAVCGRGPSLEVVVRLASPAESIDFLVFCPASASAAKAKG
jgi:hypothetical protein